MIVFSSLRAKLTAWYLLCLVAMLCVFGAGARWAMKASLLEAVDHDLAVRFDDVRNFLKEQAGVDHATLLDELQEQAMLGLGGGQLELWDGEGRLLFRSARLREGELGPARPPGEGLQSAFVGAGASTYRVVSQRLAVKGHVYGVRVGQPMREFQESTAQFDRFLLLAAPALLLLAGMGGYVLSQRALVPVDRITGEARAISIANLSSRLQVPPARDELQRLVLTLNEMLARIDASVQRMVQFTGDASHELRTPLTLMHTAAEFSLRGERSREELLDGMRRILRESVRTTHLVDDLLLLARADEVRLVPVDLAEIARLAADQAAPLAEARQIELIVKVPAPPVLVDGDEAALTRLVLILLDNAIKYSDPGATVSLSLDGTSVTVADTGVGIDSADLGKIWDRFWRADPVRSRNTGGAGLGLSIARAIADRHGASLDARSEKGRGSQFTLRLTGRLLGHFQQNE